VKHRTVKLHVSADHAKALRTYVTRAMRALPRDVANNDMHIWLQLLASEIEQAHTTNNVVALPVRPELPPVA